MRVFDDPAIRSPLDLPVIPFSLPLSVSLDPRSHLLLLMLHLMSASAVDDDDGMAISCHTHTHDTRLTLSPSLALSPRPPSLHSTLSSLFADGSSGRMDSDHRHTHTFSACFLPPSSSSVLLSCTHRDRRQSNSQPRTDISLLTSRCLLLQLRRRGRRRADRTHGSHHVTLLSLSLSLNSCCRSHALQAGR